MFRGDFMMLRAM